MKSSFLKSIFLTKVIFAEQALKPGFRLSSSVADDENSIPPGALFPDTLSGPGARKLPQIKKMLDSEMSEYTIGDLSKIIKNYGCYCNIGSKQVGHKFNYNSNPVDELDHLCKQLNRSLKCLEIDYQNGIYQQQCDKMSSYRWYVDEDEGIKCFSGDEEASWKELKDDGYRVIKEKIEKLESKKFVEKKKKDKSQKGEKNLLGYSNCQYDLCSLERHFVYQVKALLRNKDYIWKRDYYKMDDQTYKNICKHRTGNPTNTPVSPPLFNQCCGFDFGRKFFNNFYNECCDDGNVRPIGTC